MDSGGFEYASLSNLSFIEKLYASYLERPESVDASWRYFFEGMELASSLQKLSPTKPQQVTAQRDLRSFNLIEGYREYGHLAAECNPLAASTNPEDIEQLKFQTYEFKVEDLEQKVLSYGLLEKNSVPLEVLFKKLKGIYCSTIGVETAHVEKELKNWILSKIEKEFCLELSHEEHLRILTDLNRSEVFESFIQTKYPGQKRFSLEGGEVLIPFLRTLLEASAELGVKEAALGMAHRGRLNVLANILQKSYSQIFYEFSSSYMPSTCEGSGDVKYHKGFKASIKTFKGKSIEVDLCENPSHLESVNPVLEGLCKAKQMKQGIDAVLPVLIHGDASLAGQGVVYETLQLSQLEGYSTGGTVHIVINNQVGFTATPHEGRSTRYCTDIAKGFGFPVFHVSGDDPEACVRLAKLVAEVRHYFKSDVFIDIICYRKYGHSEGDEPFFTQPKLYQGIKQKKSVRNLYRDRLIEQGKLSEEEIRSLEQAFQEKLHAAETEVNQLIQKGSSQKDLKETSLALTEVDTRVQESVLIELAQKFCIIPTEVQMHPKIHRLFGERLNIIKQKEGIDWGLAEYLTYATLLMKGHPVRISGQDCQRGTFAHRHAVVVDQATEKKYFPLQHLDPKQGSFTVYNSFLSEYAVMGFEFGYAQGMKEGLTIWEAQFGDFANGAQIIIDQYLAAAQQKWSSTAPLVLFLPHGYEGQGPEHSSARIERFLQLAAQSNMYVIVPTRPSQVFHALRRHVLNNINKPLVLFTPKAILRYPPSLSLLKEFSNELFQEIFEDKDHLEACTMILCSGKIYYELMEAREMKKAHHIAIIRIEQLYPLNKEKLKQLFKSYSKVKQYLWVQEEHKNMGAYEYIHSELLETLPDNAQLCYVGRARSASPAAGSIALHQKERDQILRDAFGEEK